ncbi:MAG: ABC transporter ATP-binding protein [Planctomycetes bacterium]|jgi:phospholipid/cholesterol/gamma-HCH transport system ATP-binding protein|nr:ABC transporter ATP-binding protein [Planctomycetota bacterium]
MTDPVVVVDQVHKSFGGHRVLTGVTLSVTAGETVAILGRSGTGKSVLLKTIIALLDPDRGSVQVFGKNLHALDEDGRRKARAGIGYVFQGAALFDSLTVLENVGFAMYQQRRPEAEIRTEVMKRLEMVGLADAIDKVPSELSGGMQKRVGLARAIIGEPKLILYDEPTTGLDPLTTDVINRIILRLRRKLGVTSIVVTHDIKSAFTIADRIIMLEQGLIVAEGTPDDIQASGNLWVRNFITGHSPEIDTNGSRARIPAILVDPPVE